MVIVAQSVRALDCGSRGRGFEPHLSPETLIVNYQRFFLRVLAFLFDSEKLFIPSEKTQNFESG